MSCIAEEWRPIRRYKGVYEVSDAGRVRRAEYSETYSRRSKDGRTHNITRTVKAQVLNQRSSEYLGPRVLLGDSQGHVTESVAYLVAEAFVPNPRNNKNVIHIDGDIFNNNCNNLLWSPNRDKVKQYGTVSAVVDRCRKHVVCIETGEEFDSIDKAAISLGVSSSYLRGLLCKGKPYEGLHFIKKKNDLRIKCLDTGEIFQSRKHAEAKFGIQISGSIERKSCADGYTFIRMSDNIEDEEKYLKEARDRYSMYPRANKRWEREDNDVETSSIL